jgi:ankyrin repeat protein
MCVTPSSPIVEMKGCADRGAAETYARTGNGDADSDDPIAAAVIQAIQTGDAGSLQQLLDEHPGLASASIQGSRTPLHVATDWPGYFPNGPAIVRLLLDAGADPDAANTGRHAETPLHWAASTDDVDVAAALIDGGANIEAPGGSIAGTPLANAVGYGCWHVARLLVERGARVESLWQAAALGMLARVEEFFAASPPPTSEEVTAAFWQSCHGGQRRMAEYLLARGADLNGKPDYAEETPLDIAGAEGLDTRREALVTWLREQGAAAAKD